MDLTFQFSSISEFLWMEGHGPYVWASYAITLICLIALAIAPLRSSKAFMRQQRALNKRAMNQKTEEHKSPDHSA